MMEEKQEKMTEADVEMPIEIKEKSVMPEEMMKKIADLVSENKKAELLKIEGILAGIESTITACKEMTEIGLKDIGRSLDT
eukprot:15983299-Heterocapsa_arctica.AAC.1